MGGVEGRGEKEIDDGSGLIESMGMGIEETERLFKVMQVDVIEYEEKGFDVDVMGDFNARIDLGTEDRPNSNGKRLSDLVKFKIL